MIRIPDMNDYIKHHQRKTCKIWRRASSDGSKDGKSIFVKMGSVEGGVFGAALLWWRIEFLHRIFA